MASRGISDKIFLIIVYTLLTFIFIAAFYPFWNILIRSFSNYTEILKGSVNLFPRGFNLDSYTTILSDRSFISGLKMSVFRTLIAVPITIFFTVMLAYPLSKKNFIGGKMIMIMFIFTMYFSGGLIPLYMVLKAYNLIDNFWVYVFPTMINVFYMILVRSFIQQLPHEIEESGKMDGANDITIFFKLILPITTPVLATITLFSAVYHWNAWFDSFVFTYKPGLKTLQVVLLQITEQYESGFLTGPMQALGVGSNMNISADTIRTAATFLVTLPVLIIFPFFQKYFVKGMTLGAVKA